MTDVTRRPRRATAVATMPAVSDYLAGDRLPAPAFLTERSTTDLGNDLVDKDRYLTDEWAAREAAHLWKRVWQLACRENDIPEVGDRLVYDILDQSVLLVRVAPEEIKAYHNVCRHRGTQLVEGCGHGSEIRCSFHAWAWELDGRLKEVPCRWDFPEVRDGDYALAEVKVGRWDGWVFITLDSGAPPLEEHLGAEIPEQFRAWPRRRAWKAAHVGKVVPCNWKVALEAFLEAYHVVQVHPQTLEYVGDCNTQYDLYGPHARFVTAMGVPSPHLGDGIESQAVVDAMIGDAVANIFGPGASVEIPQVGPGQSARPVIADFVRGVLTRQTAVDYSAAADSSMIDAIEYFVFPNFVPWGGYSFPMAYRARPCAGDPRSSIWEVMVFATLLDTVELPPDMPLRMTPPDEPWAAAVELGALGPVIDQDMVNLRKVQRGLRSDGYDAVTLANYQERTIRNFHQHLVSTIEEHRGQARER